MNKACLHLRYSQLLFRVIIIFFIIVLTDDFFVFDATDCDRNEFADENYGTIDFTAEQRKNNAKNYLLQHYVIE